MAKDILFIHESLWGGGAETALTELLRYFDTTKYRITVLVIFENRPVACRDSDGYRVLTLLPEGMTPHTRLRWHVRRLRDRLLRDRAAKVLGNKKFDVTISFMEGDATLVHSMIMDKATRNMSWVHCDFEHHHWSRRYFASDAAEAAVYKAMDATVFVSESIRKSHIRLLGTTSPTYVIPNIIDHKRITDMAAEAADLPDKRGFTLCCVCRLHPCKRVDRFIQAIALLRNKYSVEVTGWIVGSGETENSLRKLARQSGVEDSIIFTGFRTNPYPFMKAADTVVLTSDAEGLPTVVAEAMALGKPVVSTDVSGVRELAGDDAALIAPTTDPEDIALTIKRVIDNPALKDSMAACALRHAQALSPSSVIGQVTALIENR